MSSSAEQSPDKVEGQESRVDSMVAKALEAAKNPFLWEIGIRIDSPSQVPKVCEILGLTNEEEKITKALVWLKKNEPEKYRLVLQSSEAKETKKRREKMKIRTEACCQLDKFVKIVENSSLYTIRRESCYGSPHIECYPKIKGIRKIINIGKHEAFKVMYGKYYFETGPTEDMIIVSVYDKGDIETVENFVREYKRKTGKKAMISES